MKRIILLLAIAVAGISQELQAQKAAIKTNLLSDTFMNVNLGIEIGLAPNGHLILRANSMVGRFRIIGDGNTGPYNLRLVIGSATVFPDIFLGHICMGGSIT